MRARRLVLRTLPVVALVSLVTAIPRDVVGAVTRAVVGGTVHPITSPPIVDGVVLIEDDRIAGVGSRVAMPVPEGVEVIDASGLHVWPALIDPHTITGLIEIGSVRGTVDHAEEGAINPSALAAHAIDPDGEIIPVTRSGGVLLTGVLPTGGLVSGTAAAIALDGWTWEEMVRNPTAGLVVRWPSMSTPPPWTEPDEARITWQDRLRELDELLAEARAYAEAQDAGVPDRDRDVQWEALVPVVRGERPMYVVAHTEAQIREAVTWTDRADLRMVLFADGPWSRTSDAIHVAGLLAERGIPVVMATKRIPIANHDPYDVPFAGPSILHRAGVDVAFATTSPYNARHLAHEAGRAVAYGLPREVAERGLTLIPARVLGIDDRYGSLEVGKSATLILVDGDLLETRTRVRGAILDGRDVDLQSKHTRLYERYRSRPRP